MTIEKKTIPTKLINPGERGSPADNPKPDFFPHELNQKHIPSLDGLRGVAIIMVILCHVFINTKFKLWFDGVAGVDIFFVLSGFLITTLLLKEKANKNNISLKNFYIRRAIRIMPVAYLYLFVLCILNFIFHLNISALSFFSAGVYIKNVPLLTGDWWTGHFWSLSVEEQFYLICPFFIATALNKYTRFMCLFVPFLFIVQLLGYNEIGVFYSNHLVHIISFAIINLFGHYVSIGCGSLAAIFIAKGYINISRLPSGYFLSFSLFVVAILVHTTASIFFIPYSGTFLFPCLITIVIVLNLKGNNLLTAILNNKILAYIGVLSYSIYIWQQLFTENQPWKGLFKYSDSLLINIPAMLLVSYLSYNFYEKKFLVIKDRFK